MQAHRGVGGLSIGTTFLKIGRVVFDNQIFEKIEKFFKHVSKKK